MTYNILAINPGHNGAAALVSDGKLVGYIEEERITRMKYDGNPFRAIDYFAKKYFIHELVLCGTQPAENIQKMPWTGEDPYLCYLRKLQGTDVKINTVCMGHQHHLLHAASAFYNSGFETATALIVDGSGSHFTYEGLPPGFEAETIFDCSYPNEFKILYKNFGTNNPVAFENNMVTVSNAVTVVKAYEAVTEHLGFGFIEAGKTMGLSSYGQFNDSIPELIGENNRGNREMFIPSYPAGAYLDVVKNKQFQIDQEHAKDWHNDPSKVTQLDKDLAWKIQNDSQEAVARLIQQSYDLTGNKNIVIAGGYGLNCVANYFYLERFPDFNIYIDPISHDGGSTIGAAKMMWYMNRTANTPEGEEVVYEKDPMTTLYLGTEPEYDLGVFSEDEFEISDASTQDIAQLISEENIVSLFNGRAEGGPRALGNRSILFDPRVQNGKDIVNVVKGREWFRPFAGSCLKEKANEWFDMRNLEESPFMMYAVDVLSDKLGTVPSITHVDGTCRIQTVTSEQNKHYYELIKEFDKITGVPILFNTSFNLAGDPLVDTLEDAKNTLLRSQLKYLYVPELGKLITKKVSEE